MEHSDTAGLPPRADPVPAGQQAPAAQARPAGSPESPGGASPDSPPGRGRWHLRRGQQAPAPPWRVEGMPDKQQHEQDQQDRRRGWSRVWGIVLALIVLNWIMGALLTAAAAGATVPYTFFLTQVNANNVQAVTSTGNTIQGTLRHQVSYATGSGSTEPVQQFTTERPAFANDNLLGQLQANGVTVTAKPVQQGTSRVRDLFDQAKQVAPAIIFIDELDAIGRARSGGASVGGHDEQEQTLNQILTEMDGFTGNEGVVVLAATNRPEILDQALLRPGRFDRRVTVSPPDQRGRRQILAVHTRNVPLAPGADLDALAASTPGMVGADLKNLVNEAALLAARRGHERVTMPDFTDSLEKIVLGTVRGIVLDPREQERTAYHESGHALLGMLTPGADPVRKISIIPRGQALGVTFQAPQADQYGYSAAYLRGRIAGALGGRAAEEVIYGDVSTGAENDMEHATSIARQMAGRWGMSPAIGPVTVLPPAGQESPYGLDVAPATRELVDTEARKIIEECYRQALDTLRGNRERLDHLAQALLAAETLEEDEAYAAAGVSHTNAPATVPAPAAAAPGS